MTIFLKVYTIVFTGMLFLSLVTKVIMKVKGTYDKTPKAVQIEETLMVPVMALGLMGSLFYLFDLAILSQTFWQVFAVLFVSLSVCGYWMPKFRWMKAELDARKFAIVFLILNLLNLPFIYMLFVYAFVSYPVL